MARTASIHRETAETRIEIELDLDGTGQHTLTTGVGFFDHMLTHLARHSMIDMKIHAAGDLHIDAHHTVEDVGIAFGACLKAALGDKAGIARYGSAVVPMDDVLVAVAIDLSGRPYLVWNATIANEIVGNFHSSLAEEFFRAVSSSSGMNLHLTLHHGHNTHHAIEACFKAFARALRQAVEPDPRSKAIPSTKGSL